jgi:integrase
MTLSQVKRQLKRHQAEGRPEPPTDQSPATPLLWEHFDEALRSKTNLRRITREGYVRTYKRHIHEPFGAVPVDQITRKDVEIWVAERSRAGLAPATVAGIIRVLRMALNVAVKWDLIAKNPAAGIQAPKPNQQEATVLKVLTPEQVHALLNHPDNTLRVETMLRAAAHAGLRRAELCGLRWGDIDWDKQFIHVQRGYNDGPTKSGRSREVPINGHFIERLRAWHEESTTVEGNPADGHVWPGKDGGEMHSHTPTQAHARAMERAGLVHDPASTTDTPRKGRRKRTTSRPLVTLHGLRHTFVSTLLAKGGKLIDVSRVAGHADPAITAKVYAHLLHDDQVSYLADLFDEPEAAAA